MRTYIRAFRIAVEKAAAYVGLFNDLPPFLLWLWLMVEPLIVTIIANPACSVSLALSAIAAGLAVYAITRSKPPML